MRQGLYKGLHKQVYGGIAFETLGGLVCLSVWSAYVLHVLFRGETGMNETLVSHSMQQARNRGRYKVDSPRRP